MSKALKGRSPSTCMRRFWFVLALLLVFSLAHAVEVNMYVFAVTEEGEGVPARLVVDVSPGSGHISIDVGESIVGESTQESVRNAIEAAADLAGVDWRRYDYYVQIISPSERVDGPSAGLPMALAFYSAFKGLKFPQNVGATGQIYPDGTVGPVGGIFPKAEAAHSVGIEVFLIPAGERNTEATVEEEIAPGVVQKVTKTVDIVEYAKREWNMSVYEVRTLSEAVQIVFEGKAPELNVTPEAVTEENFNPPAAPVTESNVFAPVVDQIIKRAEKAIGEAEDCGTLPPKMEDIVPSLDGAKSMLRQAKKLEEKGYYYTAANYAFIATIDARIYALVCKHPSIINPNSFAFHDLVEGVRAHVESVRQDLEDVQVGRNNAEMVTAARERWIRAYMAVQSEDMSLRDVVSADEWAWAADAMAKRIKEPGDPLPDMEKLAKEWIISAEDVLAQRPDVGSDVHERITWAREAYRRGWYVAAALAAAEARGLAIGYAKSLKNPYQTLADEMKSAFTPSGVWDELYLNHARYYYEAAKYYRSAGAIVKSNDMATTGIEMYYMAQDVSSVVSALRSAPVVRIVEKPKNASPRTLLLLAAIILLASAILLLVARRQRRRKGGKADVYRRRLAEVEAKLKRLQRKRKKTEEDKKEIAKLKRLAGRYRQLLRKAESQ